MTLEEQVNARMKDAMRARDKVTVAAMRMVKSRVTEAMTEKNFNGNNDDALWLSVIKSYVKSLTKSIQEYEALGEAGIERAANFKAEVETLTPFLPQVADEAQTRVWAETVITELGDQANFGMIMKTLRSTHGDMLDSGLAAKVIKALLA